MIRRVIVEPSSRHADGTMMFPGQWVETWALSPIGVWFLIHFHPVS